MRIIIVCICAIKRKGDLFNARGGDVFPASRRMGLRGTVVTRETASPLPILVGGGEASGAGLCGSAGAGSLAAGAATGLSCGEGVVTGRVAGSASQGFSCGQIRSNIFRVTPLVQPKPSCSGYSRRRRRCRSSSRHTSPPAFAYCHRYAARWSGSAR